MMLPAASASTSKKAANHGRRNWLARSILSIYGANIQRASAHFAKIFCVRQRSINQKTALRGVDPSHTGWSRNYILLLTSRAVSEVASPARSMSFPIPLTVLHPATEPITPTNINIATIALNMRFPIQIFWNRAALPCSATLLAALKTQGQVDFRASIRAQHGLPSRAPRTLSKSDRVSASRVSGAC
jgi:hypothetical protein